MPRKPNSAEPKKLGRPSDFTQEVASAICERIADGESLRSICDDDDMPAKSTVFLWLAAHPQFSDQYARAREAQADSLFDEALDIADDGRNDWVEKERKDGTKYVALNEEAISRSRLRIDTRRWMAGKLQPKKYGERVTTEHTDPQGNNPFAPLMEMVAANGRPRPGS